VSTDEPTAPDVDALVEQLRVRVEQRRQAGDYPPGMEEELDEHFRVLVGHRRPRSFDHLHERLDEVRAAASFVRPPEPDESRMPGGKQAHRLVSRAVGREIEALLAQVQAFADAVKHTLIDLAATIEDPGYHVHGDLAGQLDALEERVALLERTTGEAPVPPAG
jgi:hypothetical protein